MPGERGIGLRIPFKGTSAPIRHWNRTYADACGRRAVFPKRRPCSRVVPPTGKETAITSATLGRLPGRPLHPLHAVLLASTVPLFAGALLSDIAYHRSAEIQWSNFASWLIVGGMVFCGCALLWAIIELFRSDRRAPAAITLVGVLLATFVLGFVDALVHAKDAWAVMPGGLILSLLVAPLAIAATWIGFSRQRAGEAK